MNVQGGIWPLIMARVLFHLYSLITVRNCYKYVWRYMVIDFFLYLNFEVCYNRYTVGCWWLLMVNVEMFDYCCSIGILFIVDDCWWWLLRCRCSVLLWCMFSSVLMIDQLIDWVCISDVTLMTVDVCYFSIPIVMILSMFQHLYVGNANDDLELVVAWF